MEIKSQVASLSLAKKLKELGVEQDSYLYWNNHAIGQWSLQTSKYSHSISAFTVAELGEILSDGMIGSRKTGYGDWACVYVPSTGDGIDAEHEIKGMTEADARAQMLSYLIQNNLLPTPSMKVD